MTTPVPESPPIQAEEQKPKSCLVNLVQTIVFSTLAVVICAIIWGAVAYFTNTIYFWGAIVIGLIVSVAAMSGFQRVNLGIAILMLLPCLALTLLSVALGDYIYYTLAAAKEFDINLLAAAKEVAEVFIEIELTEPDGKASMLFGGIGALIGFYNAARSG